MELRIESRHQAAARALTSHSETRRSLTGAFPFHDPDFQPGDHSGSKRPDTGAVFDKWMTELLLKRGFPCSYQWLPVAGESDHHDQKP